MSVISYRLVSSLEKCFWDQEVESFPELKSASALQGERYSFQLIWRSNNERLDHKQVVFWRVESPIADAVSAQVVESVPVRFPAYKTRYDDDYLRRTPDLYPDLMIPAPATKQLYIVYADTRSLWIDVNVPKNQPAGEYPIRIYLVNANGEEVLSETFTLTVVGAQIPAQTTRHTEWFHADCLADYYHVPVWSEEHWRIVENFIRTAAKNSINMILTPVFTPPLDTAVGGERTTVHLVDVVRTEGRWFFGFDKLGRWIDILNRCGVEYIEISHLFTQWGAGHAPKIMATVDGEYKKVFGWETDSLGEEYTSFLDAFLPALLRYLKAIGADQRCVFHVSDEPGLDHLEQYKKVRAVLDKYLADYYIMDALSKFDFYQTGALSHPIPSNNHIEPFLEAKIPGLWTYYCCSQGVGVSNRFIAMPGYRTRVLGAQMFKHDIVGFLQWGYNFYNSQYSISNIDPYHCNDGEYFFPAGDGFAVYPAPDGTAYETLHFMHVAQAMQDIRAFELAASLCGKDAVLAAIDEGLSDKLTFSCYPKNANYLLSLREKINGMIAAAL